MTQHAALSNTPDCWRAAFHWRSHYCAKRALTKLSNAATIRSQAGQIQAVFADSNSAFTCESTKSASKSLDFWFLGEFSRNCPRQADALPEPINKSFRLQNWASQRTPLCSAELLLTSGAVYPTSHSVQKALQKQRVQLTCRQVLKGGGGRQALLFLVSLEPQTTHS